MKKFATLCFLFFLIACKPDPLVGTWEQPVQGQDGQIQGMMLLPNGKAESVNMNTLVYENWQRKGQLLILEGKSIGNGQTIEFYEEYEIKKLDDNSLELRMGDYVASFKRQKKL